MKHRVLILLGIMTFLMLAGGQAFAHHSSTSVYIQGKPLKIEGTLKEFIWRNPHSFIKVEAPDEKGEMQTWVIEGAAPTQLSESGMTRSTLRPGDKLIITGKPGRVAEDHRMLLESIERPSDGWKWKTAAAAVQ
jgi:Family of unknown function (DUF6152)